MIELPKDAEGREIPLDTKRLYDSDGVPVSIRAFRYNPNECFWRVERLDGLVTTSTTDLRLTTPDSWEKLEDDLDAAGDARNQGVCDYFNRDKDEYCCKSCPGCEDDCNRTAMRDIASRIRKLRGEDNA